MYTHLKIIRWEIVEGYICGKIFKTGTGSERYRLGKD